MHPPLRLVIALAALVGCLALPGSASAAPPRDFVGLVSDDVYAGDADYRLSQLEQQSRIGVGLHRRVLDWSEIEVSPGVYDWSAYDSYVGHAAQKGIRILPILFNPPAFHSARPRSRARPGTYPPRKYATLGHFGAAVIRRYGRLGTFWSQKPAIRKLPMTSFQIWNEPNLKAYWASGPSPRRYAAMLKAAVPIIKRSDRRAEIVTAGVPDSRLGISINSFYRQLYKAKARRYIDTVALNPYARSARSVANKLRSLRKIMDRAKHRKARIWITEIGWADRGPGNSPFDVGTKKQGRMIESALRKIRAVRKRYKLRGVVYYAWRDGAPYAPKFRDFWGLHTGLLRLNGSRKPAYGAFVRGVRYLRR